MQDLLIQFDEYPNGQKIVRRTYKDDVPAYRTLKNHNCEKLPKVYYAEMSKGVFVVEEEFVDGVSLQEILDGGGHMTIERAAQIGMDVCEALQFLHKKGYIHRDIKPEHIILTPEGKTMVIDLDATMQIRSERNTDTQLMGTAIYAAPEQFGLVRSDQRTDIYGMGILLNEMITGVHPVIERCREGKIGDIIEKCIRINLDERYQSVSALRNDLNVAIGIPFDSETPQISVVPSPSKAPEKNEKAKIAAVVLTASILLGIGAWAASSADRNPDEKVDGQLTDEPGTYWEYEAEDELNMDSDEGSKSGESSIKSDINDVDNTFETNSPSGSSSPSSSSTKTTTSKSNPASTLNSSSTSTSTSAEKEGRLTLRGDTVYYTFRLGSRSAELKTEAGEVIDNTYTVTADPQIGIIAGWDYEFNGWRIISENCEIGATGYLHASKDGRSYKIKVVVMGEPMSAYSCIPSFSNMKKGYLKPGGKAIGQQMPNQIFVDYNPAEKTTLYLAAQANFWNLVPSCSNEHVSITKYEGAADWQYPLYKMNFENKEGGDVQTTVSCTENTLIIYFRDETL